MPVFWGAAGACIASATLLIMFDKGLLLTVELQLVNNVGLCWACTRLCKASQRPHTISCVGFSEYSAIAWLRTA